ncbi:CBO0543 family protein [Alkalihalobacillus deserti]|uniref:CBO0543 family protein n=1 Tax=Alkalihalobacillus deserti TaxID=2879466 RepID=UPI001D15DE2B|nr:CBO0543 family protein [Alkalihalobacillus deserti]
MENNYEILWKIRELQEQIIQLEINRWLQYHLFSWNWWLLIVFLIAPWFIWIKFLDRKRIFEIFSFGMLTSLITVFFDAVGKELGFWVYPIELTPFVHSAGAFDFSVIPVAYMLIYQHFKRWKTFIAALVFMALIYAFIGEPFAHWAELTYYLKWKYIYSFFYYILTGMLVRWIVEKLLKISR